MIKYSYNGIVLPTLPGGYDYALISYQQSSGTYYLLYTDGGFYDYDGTIVFLTTSNVSIYACLLESVDWTKTTISYDPNSGYTFTAIDNTTNLVWSNNDIIDLMNSTDTNYVYSYSGSMPVEVVAADQPVANFGWNDGSGVISNVTTITLSQGKQVEGQIACYAVAPDGGNLSIKWYKNGVLHKTENNLGSEYMSEYEPSSDKIESYTLQCWIYNTYNDTVTGGYTQTILVSVVESDEEKSQEIIQRI